MNRCGEITEKIRRIKKTTGSSILKKPAAIIKQTTTVPISASFSVNETATKTCAGSKRYSNEEIPVTFKKLNLKTVSIKETKISQSNQNNQPLKIHSQSVSATSTIKISEKSSTDYWRRRAISAEANVKKSEKVHRDEKKQLLTKKGRGNIPLKRAPSHLATIRREQEHLIYQHYSFPKKSMGKAPKRILKKRIEELYKIAKANSYTASIGTFRKHKPHDTEEPSNAIDYMTCNYCTNGANSLHKVSIRTNLLDQNSSEYTAVDKAKLDLIHGEIRALVDVIQQNTDTFGVENEHDTDYLEDLYNCCYKYGVSDYYEKFNDGLLEIDQHLIEVKESVTSEKLKNVIRQLQKIAKHEDEIFIMHVLAIDQTEDGNDKMQSFHEIEVKCHEYVLLLLYNFFGSRHAGETRKINKITQVNWIHNHGYLFHKLRVKCGTKYAHDPEEVQIAVDYSSCKEFPGHNKFGTNAYTKGLQASMYKQVSGQIKYPDGSYECHVGLMPGEGTKSKYEVISVVDIMLAHVKKKGFKKVCIIWDGAAGENRNKYMYLFIHKARGLYDFDQIRTCVGPPHHLFFFPDTLNAICFLWYSQVVYQRNQPVNNCEDLFKLADKYIGPKVRREKTIKMKDITFLNLQKCIYSDTLWFENARMQWKETTYSKFPNFAGKNVHKANDTIYYQNKFYEMRVTKRDPSVMIFSILPNHPDDYIMQVTY